MNVTTEAPAESRLQRFRAALRRLRAGLRHLAPFAAGVAAALLALFLYSLIRPPAEPMTPRAVSTAIAKALASATPAPAYSAQAYRAIQPSLVLIQTSGIDKDGKASKGLGSGVLVSSRGEILTALHVAAGADSIRVTFADGTQTSAKIASSEPSKDIAVLQPDELPEVLIPAVMGNPRAVRVGDEAFAAGHPFGLYASLSAGVVSGLDRTFKTATADRPIEGLIQVDAAINPGSSGGPLLNRYGQVVGIVVGILNPTEDDFFVGVGFAVPITGAGGGGRGPQY